MQSRLYVSINSNNKFAKYVIFLKTDVFSVIKKIDGNHKETVICQKYWEMLKKKIPI
jgi:hypothetical protein